jgi:hypothetical protein
MVGRGGGRYREREKHTQEINKKPGSFLREQREEHFERKEEIYLAQLRSQEGNGFGDVQVTNTKEIQH